MAMLPRNISSHCGNRMAVRGRHREGLKRDKNPWSL